MAIISLVLAGLVGAVLVGGASSNSDSDSDSNHRSNHRSNSYSRSDESKRLSHFLSLYNRLNNMVKYDFDTSKNGIKSFAETVRAVGRNSNDPFSYNEVANFLYKVVNFRNEQIGHNEAGIGAYPSDQMIEKLESLCDYYYRNRYDLVEEFKIIQRRRLEKSYKRLPYRDY